MDQPKLDAVTGAQDPGKVRPGSPEDIVAMVIAMSMAWSPVSNVYAAHPDEPRQDHDRRRRLLRAMVQAAVAPAST